MSAQPGKSKQFSTFYVAERLYGIDVMRVQEITRTLSITRVPLAPNYIHGLINLRGQISTAVGLSELFKIETTPVDKMTVVCRKDDFLMSFLVDRIGDVMELEHDLFEPAPDTVPESIRRFLDGVYKIPGTLLSVIDVDKVVEWVVKSGAGRFEHPIFNEPVVATGAATGDNEVTN